MVIIFTFDVCLTLAKKKSADTGIDHLSAILYGPIQDSYRKKICWPTKSNTVLAYTGMLHEINIAQLLCKGVYRSLTCNIWWYLWVYMLDTGRFLGSFFKFPYFIFLCKIQLYFNDGIALIFEATKNDQK